MIFKATRRALAVAALAVAGLTAAAASAADFTPSNPECIAPANPGGGWDFTCRQLGKTMQDLGLVKQTLQVSNLAGGGGGVAYAEVVNKRDGDNNLIVAASSATATRLAQGAYPGNDMSQVRWLASIGADYGVIAVPANSQYKTLPDLLNAVKADPTRISFAGGSAVGGWDHLKVLIAAKTDGIKDVRKVKYIAFNGGGEAITQLLAGSVQAFTGDLSETKGFIKSGDVRVLAVLAPKRLGGDFADIPTAKEQGIDAIGANWRGFYAPGHMSDAAYDYWVKQINAVYDSPEWKTVMEANGLAPLDLKGDAFQKFVASSVAQIKGISKEIGILK